MFFRSKQPEPEYQTELPSLIAKTLPDADPETQQIVTAVAGLFGCVSYADRDFSETERGAVEALLQTIHGIEAGAARSIIQALAGNILHISTVEAPRYARTLKQLGDRELRLHVLDMLLEIAAADEEITHSEAVLLRQLTTSLGLEQSDYNQLQSKHRDKLAALKGA